MGEFQLELFKRYLEKLARLSCFWAGHWGRESFHLREARLCRESDEMNFGPVEFEVPVRQLSSGGVE